VLHLLLYLSVVVHSSLTLGAAVVRRRLDERGQASAEYALVLLGAAAVALLIVSWATHSNKIGELFNAVLERLKGHAER
jgi:Flp pilus assembly pilin Flp